MIVLVEGPGDVQVYTELCSNYPWYEKSNVRFWPLGGDIMHKLDLEFFMERYNVVCIVDSDPGSKAVRKKFTDKCEALNIPLHKLARYSIENYFPLAAIRNQYPHEPIAEGIDELEDNTKVEDQLGFSVKNGSVEIARQMTAEHIAESDLKDAFHMIENALPAE